MHKFPNDFHIFSVLTGAKASFLHITAVPHWDFNAPLIKGRIKKIERPLYLVCASPSSSKPLVWQGVPREAISPGVKVHRADVAFLSWTAVVSHTDTPRVLLQSGSSVGEDGSGCMTHAPPPPFHLDIWHTDVEDLSWNKHGVLCHSCNVCASEPLAYRTENR